MRPEYDRFDTRMSVKKVIILSFLAIACQVLYAVAYTPTTLPNPKTHDSRNYVCNPDEIVEKDDVLFLNRLAQQLEDSTKVELCIVAVKSIGEFEVFDFCYELFQRWGIGKEGKNTGVLLFLAEESRDIRIMTGGGIEGVLTDAVCKKIIESTMMTPLQKGDYTGGLSLGALRIYEICTEGDAPEELLNMTSATNRYHYADEFGENEEEWLLLGGVMLLILTVVCVLVFVPKKCPRCGKRGLKKTAEQVINRATAHKEGLGVCTYCCKHCGHQEQKTYIIPKEAPTVIITGGGSRGGFGGGGFGGGFGGGSTFGGGAGGKF